MAERARSAVFIDGAIRLAGVLQDLQPVLPGEIVQGVHIRAKAVKVHGQEHPDGPSRNLVDGQTAGSWRTVFLQKTLHGCGVQIEGAGVDIGEEGVTARVVDGPRRGEKSE
jgi:hypothetical protein